MVLKKAEQHSYKDFQIKKIFTPPCETKIKFYREFAKNKDENRISDVNLKKYFPLDDFVNYNYATYIEIIKKL